MSAYIRKRSVEVSLLLLLTVSGESALSSSHDPLSVLVRGRLVCAESAGEREDSCSPERIGIRTVEGRVYFFGPADPAIALFADSHLRAEDLQILALRHGDDRLESIRIRLVRGGRLYDIAYTCDVCQIKSSVPGVCPCCQKELVREETPIIAP
ncbi:MAG: hypothetical protein N0A16_01640 [Blastocatellia bacterium]|nr:hypothetical protein [Blastocatellia bacterium]MCS7156415.1 hypothetical protein [Blastocatellia bacterium]MCX7751234.1 hypothetical protein [Blastocatellia bacterium]MDW8168945.1 hypothetical protein [Acidobacteriota bacterium]MDW8256706.1 hypothetical protein [Acidobacteriota bacterium]